MPVKKDETGRRYVEAEVEVPGTPEEVWQAIATGPGVTSWFVPTRVEERVGGGASFRVFLPAVHPSMPDGPDAPELEGRPGFDDGVILGGRSDLGGATG